MCTKSLSTCVPCPSLQRQEWKKIYKKKQKVTFFWERKPSLVHVEIWALWICVFFALFDVLFSKIYCCKWIVKTQNAKVFLSLQKEENKKFHGKIAKHNKVLKYLYSLLSHASLNAIKRVNITNWVISVNLTIVLHTN